MLCLEGLGGGYDSELIFCEFLLEFWKDPWEELGCIAVDRMIILYT